MTQPTPEALRRHAAACAKEEAGYIDPPTGLFVLTSHYLREQGECCGSGCRHCPFTPQQQRQAGRPGAQPCWPLPEHT